MSEVDRAAREFGAVEGYRAAGEPGAVESERDAAEIAAPPPYRGRALMWGGSHTASLPLPLTILAVCLGEGATPEGR
jgi:hypothetical protein